MPKLLSTHGNGTNLPLMAARLTDRYGQLRSCLVKPGKIPSVAPIFNSDPPSVHIELLCSLCDQVDILIVTGSAQ